MKAIRLTNKFLSYIYYLQKYGNSKVSYNFANFRFPLQYTNEIKVKGDKVIFLKTGNELPVGFVTRFHYEFDKVVHCFNKPGIKVISASEEEALTEAAGLRINVRSISNIVTLYELFGEKIYHLVLPYNNMVLMDIGMNVGYASLQFAAEKNIDKIYSYEPFEATFKEAKNNFALNPSLAQKIIPNNYGISNYNGTIEVPMMGSGEGGASTNKEVLDVNGTENLPKTTVEIRNIKEEITRIQNENPGRPLFFKIDCEGDEYPIFDLLEADGLISVPVGYIIEWHFKGPDLILQKLNRAGYKSISLAKFDGTSGMIYSFK